MYHGTIQRRLRDPEERDAIKIEGSLIEIAGEIDIARMNMNKAIPKGRGWGRESASIP